MKLLYTNILPLRTQNGKENFIDAFHAISQNCDTIHIATGFISKNSVQELEDIVMHNGIREVKLVVGMYYHTGMPEGTYYALQRFHEFLTQNNLGSVYIVRPFDYHGKAYTFFKQGTPLLGVVGSSNLGAIKLEASNLRQYELSASTEDAGEIREIDSHIVDLMDRRCSWPLDLITDMELIREENHALENHPHVERVTPEDVDAYKQKATHITFDIPLKVPQDKNDPHMCGSNINVCYANGRKRVWWEAEIVVAKSIRDDPNYPKHQVPFLAVTDDGWKFVVWTCGDGNKNFYSKDDLKIMGRWIKGRLVAAGLVEAVNDVANDPQKKGLITHKILQKYGKDHITITKTTQQTTLDDGSVVDVWIMSFLP